MVINFGASPAVPQTRQQSIFQPRRPTFSAAPVSALVALQEVRRLQAENVLLRKKLAQAVQMLQARAAAHPAPARPPPPAAAATVELAPEPAVEAAAAPESGMSAVAEKAWFSGAEDDADLDESLGLADD